MKNLFKSDSFLMVVSVFVAILLWIYVAYEQNPMHEKWINGVPVKYTNQIADFENGKLVILDGALDKIDIKIRGRRSAVSGVDTSSVTCSVNMGEIKEDGTYTLPVTFSSAMYGIELVQKKPNSVTLVVDRVITEEMDVNVVKNGDVAQGYVSGEIECDPLSVKLTGPASLVYSVDKAVVNVDMASATKDIANLCKIKLYDNNGAEIADGRISKNIEYCDIKCPVYAAKEVSVTPVLRNETNSAGDAVTVVSVAPAAVTLVGSDDLLVGIETLYTKEIYTNDITDNVKIEATLDLGDIPEGVTIRDDIAIVEVELQAEKSEQNSESGGDE